MSRTRSTVLAAVAGVLVGTAVAVALVVTGALPDPDAGDDRSADELVEAYRRSKQGTFVVEAEFTRTMADGRQLASAALLAQRPPDEVRRQLGSISGRLQGQWINCSTLPDGRFDCAPGGPVEPWDVAVEQEVGALRSYFEGDPPLYRVRDAGEGCFELEQVRAYADPPYGDRATLCFDDATGAQTRLELHREGGSVDRLDAIVVRTDVTDADFVVDDDASFAAQTDGG